MSAKLLAKGAPRPAPAAAVPAAKVTAKAKPPRLPAVVIGSAAGDISAQQATVAADGALLPVVYGRARLGGKVFAVAVLGTDLVLGLAWCLGPVDAIESVTLAGEAPPAGVTITSYTGEISQAVDATLAAAIVGYADTLTGFWGGVALGVAYSVVRVPQLAMASFPTVEAVVRGRKLYDPRTGQVLYSRNPALALADWGASSAYGMGRPVDWASVAVAADACDVALSDGSPRRALDLALTTELPVAQWADVLATYAGALLVSEGPTLRLVPDRPSAATRALGAADLLAGSLSLRRRGLRERPTVVTVAYTDTAPTPWREARVSAAVPGSVDGVLGRREEVVVLPGITSRVQAYREAIERLNAYTLTDLEASWTTFDAGLADQAGDVVTLTHPVGLSAQPMRITEVRIAGPGRWEVSAWSYDSAVYSDSVLAPQAGDYTSLPSPALMDPVGDLTAASGTSHLLLGADGSLTSRIYLSWTRPASPYYDRAEVHYRRAGDSAWAVAAATPDDAYCAPVQDSVTYEARVRAISSLGVASEWQTLSHEVLGKSEPPPPPTQFLVSADADGTRRFTWSPATPRPADLAGYELRYRLGTEYEWADLSPLHSGVLTSSPYETNALGAGTYVCGLASLDTSGNYSSAVYCVVTLQNPRLAGVLELIEPHVTRWTEGTISNGWVSENGWLVATDSKTWASFASDGTDWSEWTGWARAATALVYTTAKIDLGVVTKFTPLVSASAVGGLGLEQRTSNDDVTWSAWAATAAVAVTARYFQARATAMGAAGVQVRLEAMTVMLDADPVIEDISDVAMGSLTGSYRIGTGKVRLPITSTFSVIRTVSVTLQNTGAGWSWELKDKDTSVGPQIWVYNGSDTLADATIDATIRGL